MPFNVSIYDEEFLNLNKVHIIFHGTSTNFQGLKKFLLHKGEYEI